MRKENLITYNQSDLIKEISGDYPKYSENNIKNILESELEHPIQIKLFFGLSLLGYVVPETTKTCFGVDIEIPNKVRVKPKITRYFVRKVNELSAEAN